MFEKVKTWVFVCESEPMCVRVCVCAHTCGPCVKCSALGGNTARRPPSLYGSHTHTHIWWLNWIPNGIYYYQTRSALTHLHCRSTTGRCLNSDVKHLGRQIVSHIHVWLPDLLLCYTLVQTSRQVWCYYQYVILCQHSIVWILYAFSLKPHLFATQLVIIGSIIFKKQWLSIIQYILQI